MAYLVASYGLYLALKDEGFTLPEECVDVKLVMPVDGVFQLEYTVNVYGERLEQLGRALQRLGKDSK
jgi:hypothetical protein